MDSLVNSKLSYQLSNAHMQKGRCNPSDDGFDVNKEKFEFAASSLVLDQIVEVSQKQVSIPETITTNGLYVQESEKCHPSSLLEPVKFASNQYKGGLGQLTIEVASQLGNGFCPSPQNSCYAATQYMEAKQSFTNTEVSEYAQSVVEKSGESGEVSNSGDCGESRKTSIYRGSTGSDISDESSSSSLSSAVYKPHKANDTRCEAIKVIKSRDGMLGLNHFRLLKRLGSGDIGCVYLSELSGTRSYFAMKVMDKAALASRKKLLRAQTEREILQSLDHPFLPTLYTHFETEKFSCLVMEFCPGGDLHALRQRQPGKYFPEHAARLDPPSYPLH